MSLNTIFEHPLNERIRKFLRLEHLFNKTEFFLPQTEEWTSRLSLESLIEILLIAREEVDAEILQELERCKAILEPFGQQTEVDAGALKRILDDIRIATEKICLLDGKIGQSLRENYLLKSVLQRSSIPGGTCKFDLPQYAHWLSQSHSQRCSQIEEWMKDTLPIRDGIKLFLSLIRGSCDPKSVNAISGLYQHPVDVSTQQLQMIRIKIDPNLELFPEVSGYKHRFNIRFMEANNMNNLVQTMQDINFSLTCCIF